MSKRFRFVRPEQVRYFFKEADPTDDSDDWVEFKVQLNNKERQQISGAGIVSLGQDGRRNEYQEDLAGVKIGVDTVEMNIMKTLIWLSDWSLEDERGRRMLVSRKNVEGLDEDSAAVIEKLLQKHELAMAERKNSLVTLSGPSSE